MGIARISAWLPLEQSVAGPGNDSLVMRARCQVRGGIGACGHIRVISSIRSLFVHPVFDPSSCPDLARGIGVQDDNAETDDQIRPHRARECCYQPSRDNGNICQCVIARRQKRRSGEAAPMMLIARQHNGAEQIDGKCACPGQRQRNRIRSYGLAEFSPMRSRLSQDPVQAATRSNIATRALCRAVQPNATTMMKLTEASSRKSILSANRDTEPIAIATANSTAK